jgi:hypothetical protein
MTSHDAAAGPVQGYAAGRYLLSGGTSRCPYALAREQA